MHISIVMPAYNEEDTIRNTVERCFGVLAEIPGNHEVVVTNDGSKDATGAVLEELAKRHRNLVVVRHASNQGYGAALADAIQATQGDLVVSIDSDGQFDIGELPHLLEQFHEDIDILTGYRKAKKDSFLKVFGDRVMNFLVRCLFGVPFKDTNCAYKIYRGSVVRKMHLEAREFQIPTEIVLKADALRLNVREAPVNHYPRKGGRSSLAPLRTGIRMISFLCYLRRKIRLYRRGILRGV